MWKQLDSVEDIGLLKRFNLSGLAEYMSDKGVVNVMYVNKARLLYYISANNKMLARLMGRISIALESAGVEHRVVASFDTSYYLIYFRTSDATDMTILLCPKVYDIPTSCSKCVADFVKSGMLSTDEKAEGILLAASLCILRRAHLGRFDGEVADILRRKSFSRTQIEAILCNDDVAYEKYLQLIGYTGHMELDKEFWNWAFSHAPKSLLEGAYKALYDSCYRVFKEYR